jgi:hypothetical protein
MKRGGAMTQQTPDEGVISLLASGVALIVAIFRPTIAVAGKFATMEQQIVEVSKKVDQMETNRHEAIDQIRELMNEKFDAQHRLIDAKLDPIRADVRRLVDRS